MTDGARMQTRAFKFCEQLSVVSVAFIGNSNGPPCQSCEIRAQYMQCCMLMNENSAVMIQ